MLINEINARLNTNWVNYNCGVRMAGRLHVECEIDGKWHHATHPTYYTALAKVTPHLEEHKDKLIAEFFANVGTRAKPGFVPELRGAEGFRNPIFPSDQGKYAPTVILVADEVSKLQHGWVSWAGMVKELRENPKHGATVIALPHFNNATYGEGVHISRVWYIVPPQMTKYLSKLSNWTPEVLKFHGLSAKAIGNAEYSELQEWLSRDAPKSAAA